MENRFGRAGAAIMQSDRTLASKLPIYPNAGITYRPHWQVQVPEISGKDELG